MSWHPDFSCCIDCGSKRRAHKSKGRCGTCYTRWFRGMHRPPDPAPEWSVPLTAKACIEIAGVVFKVNILRRWIEDDEAVASCEMPSGNTITFPMSSLIMQDDSKIKGMQI